MQIKTMRRLPSGAPTGQPKPFAAQLRRLRKAERQNKRRGSQR